MGRAVGVLWGSLWVVIGLLALTVIGDSLNALPRGVEGPIAEFLPVLLTIAGPDASSLVVTVFFGVFAAVGLIYGPIEIKRALTREEYVINLTRSST